MAFGKKKQDPQTEQIVCSILDSQEADVLVLRRERECEVLFTNTAAKRRMENQAVKPSKSCGDGYSQLFPDLCENCPIASGEPREYPVHFDVHDGHGRTFSTTLNVTTWVDGSAAFVMNLRDVDDERNASQKLYNLAYIDHLTHVPNRQKLKEDYEKDAAAINSGALCGAIAIFDLDNFKNINDTYGHNTGDIMLQRLTEHLTGKSPFAKTLYRLGGDEFVFLFTEKKDRFPSVHEMHEYYSDILKEAFMSYTMPNIEDSCTISMGVAFFPEHGITYSELLRKADIALYKAKAAGRNQMVLFEDQYDSAKKFKDLYINIQPILTSAGRTYGYEMIDSAREGVDQEEGLNLDEMDRTIDALGVGDLSGDAYYFLSYTNQLLSHGVRKNLPKDVFIIQIDIKEDLDRKNFEKYKELQKYGYSIALAGVTAQNARPEVMGLASYVRFAPGVSEEEMMRVIKNFPQKRYIATNIDTAEALDNAQRLGFVLFQGFFFEEAPPVIRKTKDIEPIKVNYYRLLKLSSADDYVDFHEISEVIASDVALSYKLLRMLNSAAVGLRNPISSIEMAVAYLGEENLKKWISMLALRGVAADKPLELVRISLIRAQFGELLAPLFKPKRNPKHVFLTGMFSLLHIALEKTKEELLEEIPVAEEISESLLTARGPHSDLIAFFSNYEYANWDEVAHFARNNGLSDKQINDAYIAAVRWYNNLIEDEGQP